MLWCLLFSFFFFVDKIISQSKTWFNYSVYNKKKSQQIKFRIVHFIKLNCVIPISWEVNYATLTFCDKNKKCVMVIIFFLWFLIYWTSAISIGEVSDDACEFSGTITTPYWFYAHLHHKHFSFFFRLVFFFILIFIFVSH